eukprot:117150-Pyramimonas_sp.AAC.1
MIGMWPLDSRGREVAKQCLDKFTDTTPAHLHRVTYRVLSTDGEFPFGALVRSFASGEDPDP